MSFLRYILPFFILLLFFCVCPIIYDPNAAAKGYLFFFFSFLGLFGLILYQGKLHLDHIVVPLVVLAGVLFVSSWSSRSPASGLVFVIALLTSVVFFLFSRQIALADKEAFAKVIAGVALVALLFATLGAGQFIARVLLGPPTGMYIPYLLPKAWGFRLSGPFGQPNFHALLMVVGLCAHGYIYLSSNKLQVSRLTGRLFSLPVLLLLVNLFLTQSRGGKLSLVAVITGFLLWLLFWYRKGLAFPFTWRPLVMFCVLLTGAYLLSQILMSNSTPHAVAVQHQSSQVTSIYSRINTWTSALLMALDHPFFGVGPDNFNIHLHPYQVQAHDLLHLEYEDMLYTRWAHNEVLQILAEGGILGLVAVLWFVALLYRYVIRRLKSAEIPFEIIFLPLALLPFLVQSLFSWPLRFAPLTALFFTILAFSLDRNSFRWTFSFESRWLRGILTCGLLLFFGAGCWLFIWDWKVGVLKERIRDTSQIEASFQRFETLAENPFTATEVLTRGVFPFVDFAIVKGDVQMAQRLIPYVQKGISLDGAYWQWYNMARLFIAADDEAGARSAINRCLELNPIFEPAWGFLHYLDVLYVSEATGKSVAELLPKRMTEQEFMDVRYLPPPPQ